MSLREAEQFIPIIKPEFMAGQIPEIVTSNTHTSNTNQIGNNDSLCIRFCRRKFQCVFTFMILLILFVYVTHNIITKYDLDIEVIRDFFSKTSTFMNKTDTLDKNIIETLMLLSQKNWTSHNEALL